MLEEISSQPSLSDLIQLRNIDSYSQAYGLSENNITNPLALLSEDQEKYLQQIQKQSQVNPKPKNSSDTDFLTGIAKNQPTVSANITNSDAGNTIQTAKVINVNSTLISYTESLSSLDTNDFFKFTLNNNSQVKVYATGFSLFSDIDIQLFNSSAQVIAESKNWFAFSETIDKQLTKGTYYVRAYPAYGTSNYTLSVSTKYNMTSGYGLVNAAAAVAKSINQSPFAEVPNLGGNNVGADLIKAPEVWKKGYTGKGITVAVIDSGVNYTHPDLSANIWKNSKEIAGNGQDDDKNGFIDDVKGWNFVEKNNNPIDKNNHGTHVAGTIAGVKNNIGVTGIAYDAKIMPIKVLSDDGQGDLKAIADGIHYAVDNGAKVINMSLGGTETSELQAAVQYASSKGVIVVMAAGNSSGTKPLEPAAFANKWGIAVGAVDKNKQMAYFSNRSGYDASLAYVTALGVDVYSTTLGNTYQSLSGTSMASPHVAGVVALMLSANKNLTDAQVRQILTQTTAID